MGDIVWHAAKQSSRTPPRWSSPKIPEQGYPSRKYRLLDFHQLGAIAEEFLRKLGAFTMLDTVYPPVVAMNGDSNVIAAQFCSCIKENSMRAAPIAMRLSQLIHCDYERIVAEHKQLLCRGYAISGIKILYFIEVGQADTVFIDCSKTDEEAIESGYDSRALEDEIHSQTRRLLNPYGIKLASMDRDSMLTYLVRRQVPGFREEDMRNIF